MTNFTDFLLDTLKFLDEKVFTAQRARENSGYVTYIQEANPQMQERLTVVSYHLKNNLNSCVYLQARTQDALDYVSTLSTSRTKAQV